GRRGREKETPNRLMPRLRIRALALLLMLGSAAGLAQTPASRQRPEQAPPPPTGSIYWCPMHPDVRGREGDKCPLCGMMLVRAAAADYSAYVLDFETDPPVLRPRQKARGRFYVRDPRTLATVRRFDPVHERVF